jgi:putative flippase GtrA
LDKAKEVGAEVTSSRGLRMFGKNTVASTIAFALDLAILWGLVELAGLPRVASAVIAFIIPMVVFYVLERNWVFPDSDRGMTSGFFYFMVNIGIGFLVMLAVFWALLHFTPMHYLVARVLASMVSGIVIFLLNGVFNFKQL